ncbi:MAG: hypothetical protein AAF066_04665 [Pseudomonadota bacterium]
MDLDLVDLSNPAGKVLEVGLQLGRLPHAFLDFSNLDTRQSNRFYSLDFWQFPIAKVPEFINAVSDARGVAEFTFTDDLGGFIGTSEIALRGFQNAKPLAGF